MESSIDDCQLCRTCCRFESHERYFAPVLGQQELDDLGQDAARAAFRTLKGSHGVYQVELIERGGRFLCPFLNDEEHLCRIYERRPFDCRVWPYIVMRDATGKTAFGRAAPERCPVTARLSGRQLHEHGRRALEWICSDEVRRLLMRYPGLIWSYQNDVAVIAELSFAADAVRVTYRGEGAASFEPSGGQRRAAARPRRPGPGRHRMLGVPSGLK